MTKEKFLEILEVKLDKLGTKKTKVIKKYKTTITKRQNKKEKEEDIIASFGNIDELVDRILTEEGITPKELNPKFLTNFMKTVTNLTDFISEHETKTILKIILEILVIILFIAILKLPFILVRDLLLNFLDVMGITFDSLASEIIYRIVDITYLVLAIVVFINIFNKKFKKHYKQKGK